MAKKVTAEEARVLAKNVAGLDLPQDRVEVLATMYTDFLDGFETVRKIATGDREPATLTYRKEV